MINKFTGKEIDEVRALNDAQDAALRHAYALIYAHIDDNFKDPLKCQIFNECYELLKIYFEKKKIKMID
jgi:hypothetical protein